MFLVGNTMKSKSCIPHCSGNKSGAELEQTADKNWVRKNPNSFRARTVGKDIPGSQTRPVRPVTLLCFFHFHSTAVLCLIWGLSSTQRRSLAQTKPWFCLACTVCVWLSYALIVFSKRLQKLQPEERAVLKVWDPQRVRPLPLATCRHVYCIIYIQIHIPWVRLAVFI